MTKDELQAENERLGAEVAALRELLTAIGSAMPPRPDSRDSARDREEYYYLCRDRLSAVATITCGAMGYAATDIFKEIVHASAGSLRKVLDEPLPYRVKGEKRAPSAAQQPEPAGVTA